MVLMVLYADVYSVIPGNLTIIVFGTILKMNPIN